MISGLNEKSEEMICVGREGAADLGSERTDLGVSAPWGSILRRLIGRVDLWTSSSDGGAATFAFCSAFCLE